MEKPPEQSPISETVSKESSLVSEDQESSFQPIIEDQERSILQRVSNHPRKLLLGLSLTVMTGIAFEMARYSKATDQKIKDTITQEYTDVSHQESAQSRSRVRVKDLFHSSRNETKNGEDVRETADPLTPAQEQKKELLAFVHEDLDMMLLHIEAWKDLPFADELLIEIAHVKPDTLVGEYAEFRKHFSDLEPMIEAALLTKPRLLLFDDLEPNILEFVSKSTNPQIQKMQQILSADFSPEQRAKAFGLFSLFDKGMSLAELKDLLNDDFSFRRKLIATVSQPDVDFRSDTHSALSDVCGPLITKMNHLHSSASGKRFAVIAEFNATELYSILAVDGAGFGDELEPRAYPSTYQGIFDRMMRRMQKEKLSGWQLLEKMGHFQADAFISMLVQRGRFNDFLNTMNPQEKQTFVKDIFESIDQDTSVRDSLGSAAEVLHLLLKIDDAQLNNLLTTILEQKFTQATSREGQIAYGLLSIQMDPHATWIPKGLHEVLSLKDLSTLDVADLERKDQDGKPQIVMRHFFPADEDGQSSFSRFMRNLQTKRTKWNVEKKRGHYVITSLGSPRTLLMYVNDPFDSMRDAQTHADAATVALEKAGLKPTIVFNNGHIYQQVETDGSEDAIRASAAYADMKMFFSGSCGSYARVPILSAEHPHAQFISTRGTGTQNVNEAIKSTFYEMLRDPELTQLNWGEFFERSSKKLSGNKDFPKYVSPNNHTFAMVAGKFKSLMSDQNL